jgi:hypothetical protein
LRWEVEGSEKSNPFELADVVAADGDKEIVVNKGRLLI